jgi:hypothetical protein
MMILALRWEPESPPDEKQKTRSNPYTSSYFILVHLNHASPAAGRRKVHKEHENNNEKHLLLCVFHAPAKPFYPHRLNRA